MCADPNVCGSVDGVLAAESEELVRIAVTVATEAAELLLIAAGADVRAVERYRIR